MFPFSVGEPDFDTPAHIRDSAKAALDAGATRYTPVSGTPDLRRAICEATKAHRGFEPRPEQVVVSCGAKHVLFNLAEVLFQEGDEVIIPTPCWVSYPEQIRYVGATPVLLEGKEDDGFLLTPAALEAALTPRTKAVILCSPSNPTGAAYSRDELVALLHVVRERDVYVIVDEIYADLVYDGFEHVSAGALGLIPSHRLIVVDGVSKTFAMTGWRIGWSISSPEIAEALDRLQGQSTSNPTAVAQAASAAALRGPREPVEHMRRTYQARRDLFVAGLNAIPGVSCRTPQGAFYAYANVKGLLGKRAGDKVLATDRDLATWALDEAFVASVAGEEFCAPGYLRMSYACSEADLRDGLASLRRAAERLV